MTDTWRSPGGGPAATAGAPTPRIVDLADPNAGDPSLTGSKAAALAALGTTGLRAPAGVVLTTTFTADIDAGASVAEHPAVAAAYERLGGQGTVLIARSSSVLEDTAGSAMAGQFASVGGIVDQPSLVRAVEQVLESRERAGVPGSPIAVLVQPMVDLRIGGVLFGVDPVTGRSDRQVIAATSGSVEPLVSGEVAGSRYVLDHRGRLLDRARGDGPAVGRHERRRLHELADTLAEHFGGPQDIEWAVDGDHELWVLQSRPVTTEVRGQPVGPVYGPGPVAETFPEPLAPLEIDLWLPPLRDAVRSAVVLTGGASRREVAASEVVVAIDGHVAIDLHIAGELPRRAGLLARMDPRPGARRLRSAWRVGRLRGALPDLAEHVLAKADADLHTVPPLDELSDRQLLGLLHRTRDALRALHGHEVLMGMLTDAAARLTGASVALRVLAEGRREGLTDADLVERSPVVLALTPPRIQAAPTLPSDADPPPHHTGEPSSDAGLLREALRLRVRWFQELAGRAAWSLGGRLTAAGELPEPAAVRRLTLDDLDAIVTKRACAVPTSLADLTVEAGAPLPARFRRSDLGRAIREQTATDGGHGGTGAGGGTGRGVVTYDATDPAPGSVLVTTTLTPGLGPVLSRLAGLVTETGSVLSHLAILAREAGVATVVGYDGATDELAEGAVVTVEGDTGRVILEAAGADR
ncbi:MAG: PEP-utilizing enzyme [Actinomycetota bacterium]|nr:PEP-utilizing enzyme [Actinomycetota bacterium]